MKNLNSIPRRIYNSKRLKQTTRDTIKIDDKQLNKGLAKKIVNPYYFTDRILKITFNFNLNSHQINHANFTLKIAPKFLKIEKNYDNKIMREMANIYATLVNQ